MNLHPRIEARFAEVDSRVADIEHRMEAIESRITSVEWNMPDADTADPAGPLPPRGRAEGFYWVLVDWGGEWEPAQYDDGGWWLLGAAGRHAEEDLTEIGDPIE